MKNDSQIVLVVFFILLYGYSNYIHLNPNPFKAITFDNLSVNKFNNWLIHHNESNFKGINRILHTGVCPLGRIVFYLWSITLISLLIYKAKYPNNTVYPQITTTLYILAVITVILTYLMNNPLFFRSILAFILLFVCIHVLQI